MHAPLADLGHWRWGPPIILAALALTGVLGTIYSTGV